MTDKYEDYEYQKTNREKSIQPSSGEYWCDTCDRCMVANGKKCPICNAIQGGRKKVLLKKETNS